MSKEVNKLNVNLSHLNIQPNPERLSLLRTHHYVGWLFWWAPELDLAWHEGEAVAVHVAPLYISHMIQIATVLLLCTGGAYYVPYSCLLISIKFCNGGGGGPSRANNFIYAPAPPPPSVWALKPPHGLPIGSMPFHRAQKTPEFRGPTPSHLPS
jgi:hypothetical protein